MRKRVSLVVGVLGALGQLYLAGILAAGGGWQGSQEQAATDRAKPIHDSAIIVDAHEDTPESFLEEHYDIGTDDPKNLEFISLDKAQGGNLAAVFFSIRVDPEKYKGHY